MFPPSMGKVQRVSYLLCPGLRRKQAELSTSSSSGRTAVTVSSLTLGAEQSRAEPRNKARPASEEPCLHLRGGKATAHMVLCFEDKRC